MAELSDRAGKGHGWIPASTEKHGASSRTRLIECYNSLVHWNKNANANAENLGSSRVVSDKYLSTKRAKVGGIILQK
jgi:hypothetical protein